MEAHEDFNVEAHALAKFMPPVQLDDCRYWVNPKTAHRIFDLPRQSIDRYPNVGQISGAQTQCWCVLVILRAADDQRLWLSRRLGKKARNFVGPMLAVGIDLQCVAVTGARRVANAGQDRSPFAANDRMAQQGDLLGSGGD